MANLQKRPSRQAKQQRAYQMVRAGSITGGAAVVTIVLALVGAIGWGIPIVLLILTALCLYGFRATTRSR